MTSQKRELYLESGNCSSQTFPEKVRMDVQVACRLLDIVVIDNNRLAALNHSSTANLRCQDVFYSTVVSSSATGASSSLSSTSR